MFNHYINNERTFLYKRNHQVELPWIDNIHYKFTSGREALLSLLRSFNLQYSEVVLLPEFVPEGIIAPCRIENIRLKFYALDANFNPNWEHLNKLLVEYKPRLCVFIHYFGMQKNIDKFSSMCHSFNSLVLEDFAHLQSIKSSDYSGSDFKLFSLRKIIGVPDGAILQSNFLLNLKYKKISFDFRRFIYISMNVGHLAMTSLSRHYMSFKFWNIFWRYFGYLFSSYRFLMLYYKHPTKISFISERIVKKFPWNYSIQIRNSFEMLYAANLDKDVFNHLTIPSKNSCSMGYLVTVINRSSLITFLLENGIQGAWFDYKWEFNPPNSDSIDSKFLIENHFLFPTVYSLSETAILRVISVSNLWASRQKSHKNNLAE